MEPNNQITIDLEKEDLSILEKSTARFKDTYRVSFDFFVDSNKFIINTKDLDPDLVFILGYYYGALKFIENKPKEL